MTTFWNQKAETLSRDELASTQMAGLRAVVERSFERSPFFRQKMDKAGVKPGDLENGPMTCAGCHS